MSDLIRFDSENKVFHLSNNNISYLLSIDDGGLVSHLYFGKKVKRYHNHLSYPRIDRGFSGNVLDNLDRGLSKDTLPQEYSGSDSGDYRQTALIIKHGDGSRSNAFVFKDYHIQDGKPGLSGLPASFVQDKAEAQTLVITLEDKVSQVELDLLYSIFRDCDLVARSVQVRNQGSQSIMLEKVASLQLDFVAKDFETISLPGAHANERHMERQSVGYGLQRFASRRGTSSHQMNPFLALVDKKTDEFVGDAYGFSLVYSGNHAFELEKDQLAQLRLLVGINHENFEWELGAGDAFQTPEVLMVYSNQGLNGMSQEFHKVIGQHLVRSQFKNQERPILVNNWEATYFDFTEEKLRPIVDEAKQLGIEMFVLDDGWFGHRNNDQSSLGDWFINHEKFPQGVKGFADYVHQQGLKFGLWFEPEMISMDSDLFRNHPDYLMQVPGRQPSPSRSQFVLDMGRQEVRDNIFNQVKDILDQGYIDYIKWDMNRHLSDIYSLDLPAHRQGETSHRYVLGVYDLLERITSAYPQILFEGCSGGGGRFDAGWAYYMPQSWASDNTDAISRLTIQYGTSLVYPISMMTSHVSAVPNHQTGRITPLDTRAHVAMSGVLGYELDLTSMSDEEKEAVREEVEAYKAIRPLVQYGKFYRLKSPSDGNATAWQFVSKDKTETLLFTAQTLAGAQPLLTKTKMVGLNPDADYEHVALFKEGEDQGVGYFTSIYASRPLEVGAVLSGDELMNMGIYDPVVRRDFVTHLYYFKIKK